MLAHPPMPVDGTPPQLLALDKPVDEASTVPSCDSIATGLNSWGQPYKPVEALRLAQGERFKLQRAGSISRSRTGSRTGSGAGNPTCSRARSPHRAASPNIASNMIAVSAYWISARGHFDLNFLRHAASLKLRPWRSLLRAKRSSPARSPRPTPPAQSGKNP